MSNRGGKRENAGRPHGQGKYGEPTVSIRIPQSQGAAIKDFLDAYQRKRTASFGDKFLHLPFILDFLSTYRLHQSGIFI